jgi:hypothetical protein
LARVSDQDAARLTNPPPWGYSLANVKELLLGSLSAIEAKSILEIGSYEGDLTVEILDWAKQNEASVETVDPEPPPKLLERDQEHADLVLHRRTSHEVLGDLKELPDAIVIDGDHNYFTLSEELRLIGELAGDDPLPLLMFHDVCWPHERRDTYYDAERIPEDKRPPTGKNVGIAWGNAGTDPLGLPYPWAALEEGGPRNGTLTAIEDFMEPRDGLRLVVVPAFFGFGILWPDSITGAGRLAQLLDPYDRHPVLERLERNRAEHLSASHARSLVIADLQARVQRYEHLLRTMLDSRALVVAEYASRVNQRGKPVISREIVRKTLES